MRLAFHFGLLSGFGLLLSDFPALLPNSKLLNLSSSTNPSTPFIHPRPLTSLSNRRKKPHRETLRRCQFPAALRAVFGNRTMRLVVNQAD